MTSRTPYLALVAAGAMIALLGILAIPAPANAGEWGDEIAGFFGDLASDVNLTTECGIIKPIAPDMTLSLGCAGSLKLWTMPERWPVLGSRELFADLLIVTGNGDSNPFLGGSVTLYERTRLGAAVWTEAGTRWSLYLAQPLLSF